MERRNGRQRNRHRQSLICKRKAQYFEKNSLKLFFRRSGAKAMIRALASTLVASSSGTPRKSGSVSANGISVQPRITRRPLLTSFPPRQAMPARFRRHRIRQGLDAVCSIADGLLDTLTAFLIREQGDESRSGKGILIEPGRVGSWCSGRRSSGHGAGSHG